MGILGALSLAKWPREGCQFPLGCPLRTPRISHGITKEGGDIYFQEGEMPQDIGGIICFFEKDELPQRSFQKALS
jgi:hypothetical protein